MAFVVVDYKKGNIRSVQKGLEQAGTEVRISEDPAVIRQADAIVLPGVGAFADAAVFMEQSGQMAVLRERIAAGVPFLGICLGLHLLLEWGEEGLTDVTSRELPDNTWQAGLGAIPGYVRRLASADGAGHTFKVPHVGWNQVHYKAGAASETLASLFAGIEDGSNFYFTHSYQGVPAVDGDVLATVRHAQTFPSVIGRGAAFGVQFHPEKSSHKGLQVLKNFVDFARSC